jgi:CheY-like chemotaxis protein
MAQSSTIKTTTVLLVEHQSIVRLELASRLAEMGLTVLTASNADEAITVLDDHPEIGILLTDIKMPGSMDGIRLAHHVRDRWPPVKIIVLSGRLDTQLCELPLDSIFLAKPVEPKALTGAVAHMMRSGERTGVSSQAGARA